MWEGGVYWCSLQNSLKNNVLANMNKNISKQTTTCLGHIHFCILLNLYWWALFNIKIYYVHNHNAKHAYDIKA